jgi:hypothetical protein
MEVRMTTKTTKPYPETPTHAEVKKAVRELRKFKDFSNYQRNATTINKVLNWVEIIPHGF